MTKKRHVDPPEETEEQVNGAKPEEFENFEELAGKLLKVSKEDVDEERRKAQDAPKNGRPRTA